MKFRHFAFAALASVMAISACEQEVDPINPDTNPEVYTVTLNCTGELDITQVPLSRTNQENNDLYGIQVYYAPVSGGSYKPYAYGLFDDISNVTLELLADYKYEFKVDLIVNAKNVVYSSNMNELEEEEILLGYGSPFKTNNNLTPITNEMVVSKDEKYFSNLGRSIQNIAGIEQDYGAKGVDAYYGKVTGYEPTEEGAVIPIYMKHMIYAVKVVADNFLTQGEVSVRLSKAGITGNSDFDNFTLTPVHKEYEATYAYISRESWYDKEVQDEATMRCNIDLSWIKDENTTLRLKQQDISMIRMKKTIVNVTFFEDESAGNTRLSMAYDDLEITEGNSYSFGNDQSQYEW